MMTSSQNSHSPSNEPGSDHGHGHGDGHGQGHGHDDEPPQTWWARLRGVLRPHSHHHTDAIQTAEESSSTGIRAAWIGLAGMSVTAALQLVIVAVSGSVALLADTLHNLGHLATTIPLVLAFRLGRRPATRRYTYGYRRAEDLVGLLIAVVIAVSAVLIVWESLRALVDPRPLTNLGWVFAAGVVGAAGNELVAEYRIRAGRRIGSAALIAEGQHARTDGLTSVAVVVGVVGVWLGFAQADALVGLLIAAVVIWILVASTRTVLHRLMDGIDEDTVEAIESIARGVDGVRRVDRVRARWSGHRLEGDLDLAVDPGLSVAEAHEVAERVHHDLLHGVRHLEGIAVHVNPADSHGAHDLTGHHASVEAREAYRRRTGDDRSPSG